MIRTEPGLRNTSNSHTIVRLFQSCPDHRSFHAIFQPIQAFYATNLSVFGTDIEERPFSINTTNIIYISFHDTVSGISCVKYTPAVCLSIMHNNRWGKEIFSSFLHDVNKNGFLSFRSLKISEQLEL